MSVKNIESMGHLTDKQIEEIWAAGVKKGAQPGDKVIATLDKVGHVAKVEVVKKSHPKKDSMNVSK